MIPPCYAKGVSITNTTAQPVKVTAWFGSPEQEAAGHAKICQTRELAPQATEEISEQSYNMGSWTAVAALFSLDVEPVGETELGKAETFKPEVTTIVPMLKVEVGAHPSTENMLNIAAV